MVSWQLTDLSRVIDTLVTHADINQLKNEVPCCLSAHLLFMCLRYADHCHDDQQTTLFIEGVADSLQKLTSRYHDNDNVLSFWLANTCRLLQNMKQFSGAQEYLSQSDQEFSSDQSCLTSFELSEYHNVINDRAIDLYHALLTHAENELLPVIVGGILEHQSIPGVSTSNPIGQQRWRVLKGVAVKAKPVTVEAVVAKLNNLLTVLREACVEPVMIGQYFRQVFYMLNAHLMNNLLLRKDLCHWSHGLQIRYNLNVLEEWVRTNRLNSSDDITASVQPVVQACQLLQMNKQTQAHAQAICSTCTRLTSLQIQKLLTMYQPIDDQRVPVDVIRYVANVATRSDPRPPHVRHWV